jgi:beta-lactamase regulating signal transducer with metallopeptidase domain
MMTPDLHFWTQLLLRLAVEAACVVAIAWLLDRMIRPAFWRRALWQSAAVCLLLLTASELSGFGRGLAGYFFGHARPEPKFVLQANLVAAAPLPPSTAPAFTPAPLPLQPPAVKAKVAGPVWWPGLLWLGGALVILGRVAVAQILIISLRRRRPDPARSDLHDRADAILQRLAARRRIRVLQSPGLNGPLAFGILRPSVGLPADFAAKFSRAEQDAMLAHELAHLAAHDPLWYLLADVCSAALWWQPLAWWARRRLHRASELAADEAATIFPDGPAALAGCLVTLGKQMTQRPAGSWMGVEGGGFRSNLAERVQRLLHLAHVAPRPSYGWRPRAARLGAILAISAAALGLAGCLQSRDAVKQPTLQANLSQSWDASPASTVWHSALPARKPVPSVPIPITALPARFDAGVVDAAQPASPPVPIADAPADPADAGNGRDTIVRKLQGIKLREVPDGFEQGLPLSEVLKILTRLSLTNDADHSGVNFLFNPRVGGNPAGEGVDPATITVRITPPLKNANLLQLLDTIRLMADHPLDFTVSDYAVWFFVEPPPNAALESKLQPFVMPAPGATREYEPFIGRLYNLRIKEQPSGFEQGLPLTEVLRILNNLSISNDAGRIGVNFLFNPRVGANAAGATVDPATITVRITPPLKNVTMPQFMDAICQTADQPIAFSLADYAVWFFVKPSATAAPETKPPEVTALQTRLFHVDPTTFIQRMKEVIPPAALAQENERAREAEQISRGSGGQSTNMDPLLVTRFFGSLYIILTNYGGFAYYNERTGEILARATAFDLDRVERVIELVNKVPPQVQIDVKFVSIKRQGTNAPGFNFDLLGQISPSDRDNRAHTGPPPPPQGFANPSGVFPGTAPPATNHAATITGILNDTQFRIAMKAIEQNKDSDILSGPRITTQSARQARMQVSDIVDIVTNPASATNAGSVSNTIAPFEAGPSLDVIPTVSADGFTIQMTLLARMTEFLGYENPAQVGSQSNEVSNLRTNVPANIFLPLPHFRIFSASTTVNVWDGQTVVMGGLIQDGDPGQKQSTNSQKEDLLIFITATIIDPAGNRVHTEADMPFAVKSIPPQPPTTGQSK